MTSFCTTAPSDLPQKKFPSAIIVGVKKAGTRALLEFLRLNPNIRAPGPEVHFFDKNYHKGLDWYRSHLMAHPSPERLKKRLKMCEKFKIYDRQCSIQQVIILIIPTGNVP
ncbi:hypothetical protein ANCCAN_03885 [Ancylostoma caninum]|uniref:Sulfotransferase domain-containing protein n=1 Tax=Ancylostoma caninum TaxID=29170 RepID=A0A368H463_ANCCA|nr:hypothetical protein ANCCAN_03885 [Ancylostoma caninum]